MASNETAPPVAVAPRIAVAPPEPPVPNTYPPVPDVRDEYVPPPAYTRDDRAQRDATPPINYGRDRYARDNDEGFAAPDRRPMNQDRFIAPPAPAYSYNARAPYPRAPYRGTGGYYDRYYGPYPPYRDSYGRYWYGVPPQFFSWRR